MMAPMELQWVSEPTVPYREKAKADRRNQEIVHCSNWQNEGFE